MHDVNRARRNLTAISLYTGAGGLDLGFEAAGFDTRVAVEMDDDCVATLRSNRDWPVIHRSIHEIPSDEILSVAALRPGEADVLIGGPPCQPFSKSAYWVSGDSLRLEDSRSDTLWSYLTIVEKALPQVVVFENVKGLAFVGKDEGLGLLRDGLDRINEAMGTHYQPHVLDINAADFGIPQLRERVFVVAHRDGKSFAPPRKTHAPPDIAKSCGLESYRTAWDAIGDLSEESPGNDLFLTGKWAALLPSIPEGSNYQWHTSRGGGSDLFGWRTRYWSFLLKLAKNRPSWTIQAQPGPATGPFHWNNRRLSIQELARLQAFPDGYEFCGSYRDAHRQIGNAVPPALGELLGVEIRRQFFGYRKDRSLRLVPKQRADCPAPGQVQEVPMQYLLLRGNHSPHPGTGQGPRARRKMAISLRHQPK